MKATHFGYKTVDESEKAAHVAQVFDSVAHRYDLMNDLMSLGLHRIWKSFAVEQAYLRPNDKVLDIAGGTGDITRAFAKKLGPDGEIWLTDINGAMLQTGRNRLLDKGVIAPMLQCDAEKLPFPSAYFNVVSVAFGLRNMTHKDQALSEMARVLKPGGRVLVLEFSKINSLFERMYELYSFKVLPSLGAKIAGDAESYRYLAESIRMHPDQDSLKKIMENSGFDRVDYFNLSAGLVALHVGIKY